MCDIHVHGFFLEWGEGGVGGGDITIFIKIYTYIIIYENQAHKGY